MQYPIQTPTQLAPYLRSLRKARRLTQAQLGQILGVTAARVSEIERDPGTVAFAQVQHVLQLLGAQLVIETRETTESPTSSGDIPADGEW